MEGGHSSDAHSHPTTARDSHSHPTTPHKERDGVHVKELGKEFLKLFKRKKKKESFPPPLPVPLNSSDTQKEDPSDPVSFKVQNLPNTPPTHSEATQHSSDATSARAARSATSLTDMSTGTGGGTSCTSAESVDHDNSCEEGNKKKDLREERRARYRSQGVYVVADEDDHTDFEESHHPFRVDRRLVDRLQWKDGIAPVEFSRTKKPRFKKRKEEKIGEKLKTRNEVVILKDAIPLEANPIEDSRRTPKKKKKEESTKERRRGSKEVIPIEDKTPKKKSREEKKKEELKDAIPLEEKKKRKESHKEEMEDAIPLEEKGEKKKKDKEKKEEKKEEKKDEKKDEEEPLSRRRRKRDEAVEDSSDQEKRRKKKGDDGMEDNLAEDRSVGRQRKSREEGKKREEKEKEENKEEKKKEEKKEEKKEGDEGKKKEARGGGEKDEDKKKEGGKERRWEGKKNEEEDGDMKGERETREARRMEEEKIGDKEEKLAVVPYEEWPVPALVEKVDGLIGYRVLTGGYKAAYFGYVCLHVGASFLSHVFSFDFNRSVPSSISKKLTPKPTDGRKREERKLSAESVSSPTAHSPSKGIAIKTVEYSSLPVNSSDSIEVTLCH